MRIGAAALVLSLSTLQSACALQVFLARAVAFDDQCEARATNPQLERGLRAAGQQVVNTGCFLGQDNGLGVCE